jgi:uncharacterized membrane protein
MAQPWFDQQLYSWIPGATYGVVAGIVGGLVGWLAPRGRARSFVLRAWVGLWLAGVILLAVGLVALFQGQPFGIWYGFLLTGVIGTLVVGANYFTVKITYRRVEERKLAIRDLL